MVFLASAPARLARDEDKVTVKYVEVKIIKNDLWDREKDDHDRLIKGDRLTQVSFTVIKGYYVRDCDETRHKSESSPTTTPSIDKLEKTRI